jgi:hypothetical protein
MRLAVNNNTSSNANSILGASNILTWLFADLRNANRAEEEKYYDPPYPNTVYPNTNNPRPAADVLYSGKIIYRFSPATFFGAASNPANREYLREGFVTIAAQNAAVATLDHVITITSIKLERIR